MEWRVHYCPEFKILNLTQINSELQFNNLMITLDILPFDFHSIHRFIHILNISFSGAKWTMFVQWNSSVYLFIT